MLILDPEAGELAVRYLDRSYAHPFSALPAIRRHTSWLSEYAGCGDLQAAIVASLDIEAIRSELSED